MLVSYRFALPLLALVALAMPRAGAHHSFAAEFSYDLSGTITGEVVEVLFVNPHARYFIALEGENGQEILWDAQTRSPNALFAIGWNKDTIRVGERITIEGNLGRDNARKIWIREVRKASGETVRPTGEEPPP
jgi:Family of unknown function (DUF6152)